jgi:DNA-binding NarL/FixJ family response regulator
MARRIKVAVAEPRDMIRQGILAELEDASRYTVTGEALSARQVFDLVDSADPDVFILSASLPGEDPIRLVRAIANRGGPKVLLFGQTLPEEQLFDLLKSGATGYIPDNAHTGSLARAVKAVHQGEMWIPRKLMARFFQSLVQRESNGHNGDKAGDCGLSPRETEVLDCLRKGYCNKDIASELFISEKTVKTHLGNIFRKLNVSQRLQAVMAAVEQGLV